MLVGLVFSGVREDVGEEGMVRVWGGTLLVGGVVWVRIVLFIFVVVEIGGG